MDLSLSDIQQVLKQVPNSKLQGYRIAVLRNITVESIIPYLQYYAFKSGFEAKYLLVIMIIFFKIAMVVWEQTISRFLHLTRIAF